MYIFPLYIIYIVVFGGKIRGIFDFFEFFCKMHIPSVLEDINSVGYFDGDGSNRKHERRAYYDSYAERIP